MNIIRFLKILIFIIFIPLVLISCSGKDGKFKLPGGDARKTPADPKKRIEQNIREGKGFRINNLGRSSNGGVFDFASSNELWRVTLDALDLYLYLQLSGGIIVTDWYAIIKMVYIKIW